MLQPASVQKLHEHDQRPAGPAVARFDHLHLTGAYSGERGKSGLGIAGPLADRLEGGRGHSGRLQIPTPAAAQVAGVRHAVNIPIAIAHSLRDANHRLGIRCELRGFGDLDIKSGHVHYSVAVEPLIAHIVRVVNRLCNVSANYFSGAWRVHD